MKTAMKQLLATRVCALLAGVMTLGALGSSVFAQTPVQSEEAALLASDGQQGDNLGRAVAIDASGTVAVASALKGHAGAISDSGAAYVFRLQGSSWVEEAKLIASDAASQDFFGIRLAISADGTTVVVGAFFDDHSGLGDGSQQLSPGSAYVYRFNGTNWVQEAKLIASDATEGDWFGASVGISGDGNTIVVGATAFSNATPGSAYIYTFDGVGWVQTVPKLSPNDGAGDNLFGFSAAISDDGNTAFIGALKDDDVANNSGAVYVFTFDGSGWPLQQKLFSTTAQPNEEFGRALALSSDTVLVGAKDGNHEGVFSGVAYTFGHDGSMWVPEQKLHPSDGFGGDSFGWSVAVDGDTAVIGAIFDDDNGTSSGSAYVFRFDGSAWVEESKLQPSGAGAGDLFGESLALVGETLLVGAAGADLALLNQGAVYVFRLGIPNAPPTCSADLTPAEALFDQPSPGSFVVTEGATISVPFTGADPDNDDLTAELSVLPPAASLAPTSGASPLTTATFDWTPTAADKTGAPYTVTVSFTDPSGASTSCGFEIVDINLRPICNAGANITVECDAPDGAMVTLSGSATDPDDDDAGLMFQWDVSDMDVVLDDPTSATPTGVFPVGVTMATLTVTDGRGGVGVCDVLITVQDTTPPEVMCTTDVAAFWPPKHDMRTVNVIVVATDLCENPEFVIPLTVTVRSDEPDNAAGMGDGNTTGDVDGEDGFTTPVNITSQFVFDETIGEAGAWVAAIQLRAERDGDGDGRAYTIDVMALDSLGNLATTSCVIVVPHDRRGNN